LGGTLALEMARELAASGYELGATILVDTYVPKAYATASDDFARILHLFAYDLQIDAPTDELRALGPDAALARVLELGYAMGRIPPHLGLDHVTRRYRVYAGLMAACARYALPASVPDRVTYIAASEAVRD